MSLIPNKPVRSVAALLIAASIALFLAGCKGMPTEAELSARQQIQSVEQSYRPQGQKPALPALEANSGLSNYLQYAFLNSPQVEEAYFDWASSIERITTARSLPDPQLTFQMDIQNIVSSVMPGLMMTFPGLGKRQAGAGVASFDGQSRCFTFQTRVLESAFQVKRAYYQFYSADEKVRVNRETLALLAGIERLARSQYVIGKATLQDVLRAQIEQARLRTEITNLIDSQTATAAQFKAALGISGDQPAPPLPQYLEATPLDIEPEALLQSALTNNTRLKALEAQVRSADAAITLAYKARMPDSSLGLMADAKMSPTLYRPLATVTLPVWRDKLAAQLAGAQADKRVAQARLSTEQINLAADVAEKLFIYRETTRNLELLHGELLPRTRQSIEAAQSGYLSGQINLTDLLDSGRSLLGLQLEQVEAQTQRELVLTELALVLAGMPPTGSATLSTSAPPMPSRSSSASQGAMR